MVVLWHLDVHVSKHGSNIQQQCDLELPYLNILNWHTAYIELNEYTELPYVWIFHIQHAWAQCHLFKWNWKRRNRTVAGCASSVMDFHLPWQGGPLYLIDYSMATTQRFHTGAAVPRATPLLPCPDSFWLILTHPDPLVSFRAGVWQSFLHRSRGGIWPPAPVPEQQRQNSNLSTWQLLVCPCFFQLLVVQGQILSAHQLEIIVLGLPSLNLSGLKCVCNGQMRP